MKVEMTQRDKSILAVIAYGLILVLFAIAFYQIASFKGQLQASQLAETVKIHDRNFAVVDQALKDSKAAYDELKLKQTIQSNTVGSGMIDKKKE